MNRKVSAALLVCLLGLSGSVEATKMSGMTAAITSQPSWSYGAGGMSCGKWLELRKAQDYFSSGQWVLGWVSAVGYYTDHELKETDSAAMLLWIDNHCAANPLDDLRVASKKLVDALKVKSLR